jgi:NADPH:quinone reductase
MVGGDYIPRNVKALADDGRLVQIAFLKGPKAELNFAQLMVRRLTITGSTLRPQSHAAKARIAEALEAEVWPLLAAGRIAPVMDQEFPLPRPPDAAAAYRHARLMESLGDGHIGKIVLRREGRKRISEEDGRHDEIAQDDDSIKNRCEMRHQKQAPGRI